MNEKGISRLLYEQGLYTSYRIFNIEFPTSPLFLKHPPPCCTLTLPLAGQWTMHTLHCAQSPVTLLHTQSPTPPPAKHCSVFTIPFYDAVPPHPAAPFPASLLHNAQLQPSFSLLHPSTPCCTVGCSDFFTLKRTLIQ